MKFSKRVGAGAIALTTMVGALVGASPADAVEDSRTLARPFEVTVKITNLAPDGGTNQTPVWIGVHDGSFDLYDRNEAASPELERLAEDGTIDPLIGAFAASGAGVDTVVPGPSGPIAPGESTYVTFLIDAQRGQEEYFSYASMVLPSNDAFVANGSPTAHRIINQAGRFEATSFVVSGAEVLDAGTEVNDEIPENTAFLDQAAPDTGVVEGGVVTLHPGFKPAGEGGILDDARFANADFTADDYGIFQFDITATRAARQVRADLSGDAEVPGVETEANGRVRVRLQADGEIDFRINARNIDDVLFAHIHLGAPGENGPVVVGLFSGDLSNGRDRLRVNDEFDSSALVGPLAGMSTLDLWNEILAGNAYVNIHTADHPGGELRADLG